MITALRSWPFCGGIVKRGLARVLFVVALLLGGGCWAQAQIVGEVVGVSDGDTLRILDSTRQVHKVRLAFIDAPERNMPWGSASKKALSDRVYRRMVTVHIVDTDRYGRTVGIVTLDNQDINWLQLSEGWAWHYRYHAKKSQSPSDFRRYEVAENAARAQGSGLWQDRRPQPPWQWRRQQRNSRADAQQAESDGAD